MPRDLGRIIREAGQRPLDRLRCERTRPIDALPEARNLCALDDRHELPPAPTSAISKRTVFVPMSIAATRKLFR